MPRRFFKPTDFTDSHRLVASYPQAQWSQKQAVARRFQPAKYGEGFDAPPTLERSGSEHRRAVTSLALLERARAWEWVKDPPAGEGQVGQKQHSRAVTSFPLMVKGKAWLGIKDPPAGEGQEGQKTPLWQRRDGVDRRLHDDAGISASGRRKDYVAM